MPINRLTAYKVWVSDLVTSPYIKMSGEFESNYVEVKEKQVSRVNIIGTIVNKLESGDKNYTSLVLDDGSEQIRIKAWREDVKIIERFRILRNRATYIGTVFYFKSREYEKGCRVSG